MECFCGSLNFTLTCFPNYVKCLNCGSWRAIEITPPIDVYTDKYWTHEKGRSTLEEQWNNLTLPFEDKQSRVDFWLTMIKDIPIGKSYEIGCAPGALMLYMNKLGWETSGIETNEYIASKISQPVSVGFFPDVEISDKFDLVVCTDVLEHSLDPRKFMAKIYNMLKPNGYGLIQAPTWLYDKSSSEPFANKTQALFNDIEHIFIFSLYGILNLFISNGFEIVKMERWYLGHECFLIIK